MNSLVELSDAALEKYLAEITKDQTLEATPPDQLASVIYIWSGPDRLSFEAAVSSLPDGIVRAKGFVRAEDRFYIYSAVLRDWTLEPTELLEQGSTLSNMIVFIGTLSAVEHLSKLLHPPNWTAREIVQPFTQIVQM